MDYILTNEKKTVGEYWSEYEEQYGEINISRELSWMCREWW